VFRSLPLTQSIPVNCLAIFADLSVSDLPARETLEKEAGHETQKQISGTKPDMPVFLEKQIQTTKIRMANHFIFGIYLK
jgi:hypothetical protein